MTTTAQLIAKAVADHETRLHKVPAEVPVIPFTLGKVYRWVAAEIGMADLKILTYPDDHIGGPNQHMTAFNRFTHPRKPVIHDGYLDLRATRRTDGLFDADLVGTSLGGNGRTFGYGTFRAWLRMNVVPNSWQAGWLYDTTKWTSTEIDFPEILEGQALIAGVIGVGQVRLPKPDARFHEYRIERRATFVDAYIDGALVAHIPGAMPPDPLAILFDAKVGFPWAEKPSAATIEPFLHVAAVTVDA